MKRKAIDTARTSWKPVPDWIEALAHECDKPGRSQRKVGKLLLYSGATVNLLLKNRYYPRDHTKVKARIEAMLMVTMVACPVLGVMSKTDCQKEQAKPLVTCNPVSVQLYRACRDGCRFFEGAVAVCGENRSTDSDSKDKE